MLGYLVIIGINSPLVPANKHHWLFIALYVVSDVFATRLEKGHSVVKDDNTFIESAAFFYKIVDTLTWILVKMQIRSG